MELAEPMTPLPPPCVTNTSPAQAFATPALHHSPTGQQPFATHASTNTFHAALFGLNTNDPAASLFTCCRELLENALDAEASQINVVIQRLDSRLFRLHVADDGHGFSEAALGRVSELFHSSKGQEFCGASAGVFGVGLKSVLVWAHASSPETAVQVLSTSRDAQDVHQLFVRLAAEDDTGGGSSSGLRDGIGARGVLGLRPVTVHKRTPKAESTDSSTGTRISATLAGADSALPRITRLFDAAGALLTASPLKVSLRLCDDASGPRELTVAASRFGDILAHAASGSPPPIAGVRAYLDSLAAAAAATVPAAAPNEQVVEFGEGCATISGASLIHATVRMSIATDHEGSKDDSPGVATRAVPFEMANCSAMWLNNKMVCDGGGEAREALAARCASVEGLGRVRWKRHGASLHRASLHLSFDSRAVRGVRLALHLRSSACQHVHFGDLGKTWVASTKPLVKAIAAAVEGAFDAVAASLAAKGMPISKHDRQAREETQYAESIAASISSIVCHAKDVEITNECLRALQIEAPLMSEADDVASDNVTPTGGGGPTRDNDRATTLIEQVQPAVAKHLLRDWSQLFTSGQRGDGRRRGGPARDKESSKGASDDQRDSGGGAGDPGAADEPRQSESETWLEPCDDLGLDESLGWSQHMGFDDGDATQDLLELPRSSTTAAEVQMDDDGHGDVETERMLTQGSTAVENQSPVDVTDGDAAESQAAWSSWNAWGEPFEMSFDHADGQAGFGFPEGDSQQWWP